MPNLSPQQQSNENLMIQEAVREFTASESVDVLTKRLAEYINEKFDVNPQSDKVQILYSTLWMIVHTHNKTIESQIKNRK